MIKYQLTAYVDGERVFSQLYPDTAELVNDLGEAEKMVENNIQLDDVTLDELVGEK